MHAVRPLVLLGTLGRLLLMLAALSAVPAMMALGLGDGVLAARLAVTSVLLVGAGALLARLPRSRDIQWNEALAVAGLAFLLAASVLVWPLLAADIAVVDAWFEAVSAVTTTGLTTVRGMEHRSDGFLFSRAWAQWYGGLGIGVLTVALIMRHHASSRRLLQTTGESLTDAGAHEHARRVFFVYATLTLIGIGAAWASGLAPFSALVHALAAVATGGFAAADDNIAGLPGASVAVLSAVCIAAAISLPLYSRLPRKGAPALLADPEVRAFLAALIITAGLLTAIAAAYESIPWPRALTQGLVLGVSAQTDTGFSTTDVAAMHPAAQVVLMVSMTIGGCTGSTAGGFKIIRLLLLIRLIQLTLQRTATAERAVLDTRIGGTRVQPPMLTAALQLLSLWALVLLFSWLVFLLYDQPPLASLFEVVSATANAGLSAGLTGPDLPSALKLVLTADMLFGRVEIIAMLVLLYPPTWLGRRRNLS
jgi:trk system potassium uptake protein TrkH